MRQQPLCQKRKRRRGSLSAFFVAKTIYCFFSVLELPEPLAGADELPAEPLAPLDAEPELSLFELSLLELSLADGVLEDEEPEDGLLPDELGVLPDELPDAAEPDDFSDFCEAAEPPLEAEPLTPSCDRVFSSS